MSRFQFWGGTEVLPGLIKASLCLKAGLTCYGACSDTAIMFVLWFEIDHKVSALQLAHLYHKGEAVAKDCKKAFRHLTTFLNEQSAWLEDVYSAVNALDSGMCLPCFSPSSRNLS